MYSDIDTDKNVYLAGEAMPEMKTPQHLGTLFVTKGTDDTDFLESRFASA